MSKKKEAAREFKSALKSMRDFGFVALTMHHGGPTKMKQSGHRLTMEDIAGAAFDVGMDIGFSISHSTINATITENSEEE